MIGKIIINRGPTGPAGPAGADGEQGLDGAPGAPGAPGPAPSGTGFVKVVSGVLTTPSATISIAEVNQLQPALDGKLGDSVGFYDEFDSRPNGYQVIDYVTYPKVGPVWKYAYNNLPDGVADGAPTVSNGKLYPTDRTLLYLGAKVPTKGKRFSITAEVQFDVSAYNSRNSNVTVSIANPAVITWNSHGLFTGCSVRFTTSGALPTGLVAGITYYVKLVDANSFRLSASISGGVPGSDVITTGAQSGTHNLAVYAFISNGLTIGISPTSIADDQAGTNTQTTLPANCLHIQLDRGNSKRVDINTSIGVNLSPILSADGVDSSRAWVTSGGLPVGTPSTINCTVEGDELRVTALGTTHIYRDSRISDAIGTTTTDFFLEWAGDSFGSVPHVDKIGLRRVWVNADRMDNMPGFGAMSNNGFFTSLLGSNPTFPNRLSVTNNVAVQDTGIANASALVVPGQIYAGNGVRRFYPANTINTQAFISHGKYLTADVVSTVGTNISLVGNYGPLNLQSDGDYEKTEFYGNFPTTNSKDLRILLGAFNIVLFSKTGITHQGPWKLTTYRTKRSATPLRVFTVLQYGNTVEQQWGTHIYEYTLNLQSTTTVAGDVVVYDAASIMSIR